MSLKIQRAVLFALCVVLLLVVSARVSPPPVRTESADERESVNYVLVTPTP